MSTSIYRGAKLSWFQTYPKTVLDFDAKIRYYMLMQQKKPWITEERYILKKYYKKVPMSELLLLLPGRTESSVYSQVNYLRRRKWSFG